MEEESDGSASSAQCPYKVVGWLGSRVRELRAWCDAVALLKSGAIVDQRLVERTKEAVQTMADCLEACPGVASPADDPIMADALLHLGESLDVLAAWVPGERPGRELEELGAEMDGALRRVNWALVNQ